MDSKMKAVILMATYNGAAFVEKQIDSILSQSGVELHLFVRDDGSSDETVEIINRYADQYANITLLPNCARGGSAARNFMRMIKEVQISPTDIVFLCDQDDVWLDNKVSTAIRHVANGIDLYSSALKTFSAETEDSVVLKPHYRPKKFDHLFQGLSAGCTYALSYNLVQILKDNMRSDTWYFENDFSHDWMIYTFARINELSIYHDPHPKIHYRQHDSNVQGSLVGVSGLIYRLQNISQPWFIGQIFKNGQLVSEGSADWRLIDAIKNKRVFFVLTRMLQLRRSILQSCILYFYLMTRRRHVSEVR